MALKRQWADSVSAQACRSMIRSQRPRTVTSKVEGVRCSILTPNARGEPRPAAEARPERTLEGVGSSAWFGAGARSDASLPHPPHRSRCEWLMRVRPRVFLPHTMALPPLLDHLVRQDEERRRKRDPQRLGGLAVEDHLELRGLLHR